MSSLSSYEKRKVMRVRIVCDSERVSARNIALFLASLSMLRDGIDLMETGDQASLKKRFEALGLVPGQSDPESILENYGRAAEQGNWTHDMLPIDGTVFLAVISTGPPKDDLELVSVGKGSIEVIIGEVIDKIGDRFKKLLRSSRSVMKKGEGHEYKRAVFAELGIVGQSQHVGAGLIMLAGKGFRYVYKEIGAENVEIRFVRL